MWCNRKSLRFGSLGKCLLPFILLAATLKVCKPTGSGSTVSQLAGPISGNQTVDLKCTSKTPAASKDNSTFYYEPVVTYQFNTSWEVGKANSNPPFVYQALQYQGTGKNKKKTGRSSDLSGSIPGPSNQALSNSLKRTARDYNNKDKANPQNMPKGFLVQLDFTLSKAAISNVGKEVYVVESVTLFDQNFNGKETYMELSCEKPNPALLVGDTSLCPASQKPIEIQVEFALPANESLGSYMYSVSLGQTPGAQTTNNLYLKPAPESKVPLAKGQGQVMVARFETKNMGSYVLNLIKNGVNTTGFPVNVSLVKCGGEFEVRYAGANTSVTAVNGVKGEAASADKPYQQLFQFKTSLSDETSAAGKGVESIPLCQVVSELNRIKQEACGINNGNQGRAPGNTISCQYGTNVKGVAFPQNVCNYFYSDKTRPVPGCYFNEGIWAALEANADLMKHSDRLGLPGCPIPNK